MFVVPYFLLLGTYIISMLPYRGMEFVIVRLEYIRAAFCKLCIPSK